MKKKSNWKLVLISIIGVAALIMVVIFMVNGVAKSAIKKEEQVLSAQSDIKIQEKRRVDLIGRLVECVKQYDKHEYETLKDIVAQRSSDGMNDNDVKEVTAIIKVTTENYPDLKSYGNYKQLMMELSTTENLIAQHRSNYNDQVRYYHRYVRPFPNKQILALTGYEVINFDYLDFDVPEDAPKNLFKD
jgi:LemA protein